MKNDIFDVINGKVVLQLHPGQTAAWDSKARFTYIIAGTQSGKTTFGPWWLYREIKNRGDGDYLAITATYDLFKLKMLPEARRVFELIVGGWNYHKSDRVLYTVDTVSRKDAPTKPKSRVILRAASSPGGLESSTALGAWLDECGQDSFTLGALEATLRRLALAEGRILGTTTPYNLGWLKTEVYDKWAAHDPNYRVIQFTSLMNPRFPRSEYERAEKTMQPWKFRMFYRGEFARPAGMIYDCFGDIHRVVPFVIPANWPRFGGLDFGGVHTAAVCVAQNPQNGALYVIKEYMQGGRSAAEHAEELNRWGCRLWVGGASSEDQWRLEFAKSGMPIQSPNITEVEVGISRVYAAHKQNKLYVFDTCTKYIDEKGRYSRKLDGLGYPTEDIKDKQTYHIMDAERYIVGYLVGDIASLPDSQPAQRSKYEQFGDQPEDGSRWRRY